MATVQSPCSTHKVSPINQEKIRVYRVNSSTQFLNQENPVMSASLKPCTAK